ncbi:uncharacterized protein [Diadema antillarum]|uniref:uncharacterized protein n=1 Tax=Diadema antillarum TaxID=105358 RepID=UPI003A8898A1
MTSRAVHVEVAHSLDTDSFVNALRRFIARRGKPEKIVSDNGTNFRGAERELRESLQSLNQSKVNNYLLDQGIHWFFNTPTASHMGGVWERMVRSIRKILGSLLGQQTVSDEVLSTVLVEIEGILNSRPLTQLSMDPQENEPLTPNHLLLMKQNPSLSLGKFDKGDCYGRRRWRQVQYLATVFWRRWQAEYLPLLQERQKWLIPRRNLAVNDLVLVADERAPRGQWPLEKVSQVYPGNDGLVRQAEIKVGSVFLRRPISKLCMLKAADDQQDVCNMKVDVENVSIRPTFPQQDYSPDDYSSGGQLPRRTTPPRTTPEDYSPGGLLPRKTTPPEDHSPGGPLPRRTTPPDDNSPGDRSPGRPPPPLFMNEFDLNSC